MTRAHPWELALAVVLGAVALAVGAQRLRVGPGLHHPVETLRVFATLDLNASGTLEPAELQGRDPPGSDWHLHDLDEDGLLDPRELEVALEDLDPRWLLREPAPPGAG